MIVDDDMFNILSFKHIISQFVSEENIETAYDGQEAINLVSNQLQNQLKPYHMIFMDSNMPRKGGMEAIKEIRDLLEAHNQDPTQTRIILLTAYGNYHKQAEEEAFDEFCEKPIRKEKLIELLFKYC